MGLHYDLLVVGAGCAGCMAASTAAGLGLKVLLVDRKAEAEIGRKVCGDALGTHHLASLGLSLPADCFYSTSPGVEVYSPDLRSVFSVEEESLKAVSLKRHAFGQFLLKRAISAGAELLEHFHVSAPIMKGDFVVGVKGLRPDGNREYGASVVADCSGMASVVRCGIPDEGLSHRFPREDVMACYREIRRMEAMPLKYLRIYLDQEKAPGGYTWVFPLNDELINVGLGIQMAHQSPKDLFYKHVVTMDLLKGSALVEGGGGLVPTSRPLDSMVYDGLMIAGDSASTVSPMHGGGIGSSMLSGKLLAEVCAGAIARGSVGRKDLWDYNRRYMLAYGAKQASLNAFRRFLQGNSNEEMNFGMAHRLIKPEDIMLASMSGDLKLSITEKANRAIRGFGHLDYLLRLRRTANCMRDLKRLYLDYPPFEGLRDWIRKVRAIESSQ